MIVKETIMLRKSYEIPREDLELEYQRLWEAIKEMRASNDLLVVDIIKQLDNDTYNPWY